MNPTPDQIANPVLTQRLSEGVVNPKVLSEEADNLFMLRPEKTVWGWDFGKPILDRLPFWSQAYNKGYEQGQAYVYYDPSKQLSWLGPGTCEVHTDIRAKHLLIVENGELTFTGGTLSVDRLVINLAKLSETKLNIQNGKFYVGYDLEVKYPERKAAFVEGHTLLSVKDSTLDKAALGYSATQEAPVHEAYHAITSGDVEGSWRPEKLGRILSYNDGPSFYFDFQGPVFVDGFCIKSDKIARGTSRCSVYYSDDGITWTNVNDTDPYAGEWNIDIDRDIRHQFWQLLFWDGVASIESISYTGEAFFMDKRVSAPVPIATPFLRGVFDDDNFLDTERTEMILATVEVENSIIKNIVDNRKSSKTKYEPVAQWLTDFQDANLRCRFNNVLKYAEDFLSPQTAFLEYYKELEDSHCWGVGQFDLQGKEIEINLPKVVSLYDTYLERLPEPTPGTRIYPSAIFNLKEGTFPGDAVTKKQAFDKFAQLAILDNGNY